MENTTTVAPNNWAKLLPQLPLATSGFGLGVVKVTPPMGISKYE